MPENDDFLDIDGAEDTLIPADDDSELDDFGFDVSDLDDYGDDYNTDDLTDYTDDFSNLPGDDESDSDEGPKTGKRRTGLSTGAKVAISIVSVIVLVLAILFGVGYYMKSKNSDTTSTETTTTQSVQQFDPSTAGKVNVRESTGVTYTGTDNALNNNGTGAILAFDYAYYTERSGKNALSHFDPDNHEYTAENIQAEINKMRPSTRYSLQITPTVIGKSYNVILTLYIPSGTDIATFTYNQKFTVVEKNGKYYVKSFTSTLVKQ